MNNWSRCEQREQMVKNLYSITASWAERNPENSDGYQGESGTASLHHKKGDNMLVRYAK